MWALPLFWILSRVDASGIGRLIATLVLQQNEPIYLLVMTSDSLEEWISLPDLMF
jgi:hypothetical protein